MTIEIRDSGDIKRDLLSLDVAFVIDTTSSMSGEIGEVKRRMDEIVNQIVSHKLRPRARFAVIGYRDHPPEDYTYAARTYCDFGASIESVHSALANLSAEGGGDGPESVVDGLKNALDLRWNERAQKAVLLVGDAPPHGEGGAGDKFPLGCPCKLSPMDVARRMDDLGITVHAVGARNDPKMISSFSRIAASCGGSFINLNNATALVSILIAQLHVEIGKIADDIRVIEKIEGGETLTDVDRARLKSLEKKGVRPILSTTREPERSLRIKVIR